MPTAPKPRHDTPRASDGGAFFRAILDASELAAFVLRVDGNDVVHCEDANQAAEQLAGSPAGGIVGRKLFDCLTEDVAEILNARVLSCLETGVSTSFDQSTLAPGGRVSWKTFLIPVAGVDRNVRHVVGLCWDVTNERRQVERARHNASLLRSLGLALPSAIYLLNLVTQKIEFIGGDADERRQKWRKGAEQAGSLAVENFFHPDDHEKAARHWQELASLKDGEVVSIDYRILNPDGEYRRHMNRETVFRRNAAGEVELVLGVSEDISQQDRAQEEVRELSQRILNLQAEEQRRIAQEFHDSTGQHLVAAGLALGRAQLGRTGAVDLEAEQGRLLAAIDDARQSLLRAQRELRVLSYLLHPPEIRDQGLGDAVRDFASGFARRAGLGVTLEIAPAANAIDETTSLHLFRVCQEAFTNIHRHARATKVAVAIDLDDDTIRLTITDDGVGFEEPGTPGVGFEGMQARMRRLGGALTVSGQDGGTTLTATAPRGTA
jgi:PAS domain S-box-containing protein